MIDAFEAPVLSGTIVDLPSLSLNFPSVIAPEVFRDNVVQTLRALLQDGVYAVTLEGVEGIGKTTVLSHFARKNHATTISIFISSANRLSQDVDLIRADIAGQVFWAATGNVLDRTNFEPALLKAYYVQLQHKAKQSKHPYFFIVDGMDELKETQRDSLLQQLTDILPIGIQQFRFLFSGDERFYRSVLDKRLTLKSFPLTEFSIDEARTLFAEFDLPLETLKEVNETCRGLPGRLTGALRAMQKGILPTEFDQDTFSKLREFYENDWRQVDSANEDQQRILALIAYDPKPHSIEEISSILAVSQGRVMEAIALINFLVVEPQGTDVRYATAGLRRYAAEKLSLRKGHIQKILIKRLLSIPNSDESILDLPQYMEEAAEYADLLAILTPDHIIQVLERGQTLTRVDDAVDRGFRCALKLGRDGDALRFGLQKAIISDLASANIWESEVAALTALDRVPEATGLATSAILREDRLQMLATLAHHIWLKGSTVPSGLIDQIRLLIDNLDYWLLGPKAGGIASKLVCVNPDLANTLLRKAKWVTGEDDSEKAFARFTALALRGLKDEQRRSEAIETLGKSKHKPEFAGMLEGVRVLAGQMSPEEVCRRSAEIDQAEARISTLRYWCVLNGQLPDADLVAVHGLTIALASSPILMDAGLLADFSHALPGATVKERSLSLIGMLDGLRATAERQGPSVDFVRLQLSIARSEALFDTVAAESRLVQLLMYVGKIIDLPSRGESYARCLAAIKAISCQNSIPTLKTLQDECSSQLESVVLTLSLTTADHHLALGGIISALAGGDLQKALDYTNVVNTEARRDAVLVDVIESLLRNSVSNIEPKSLSKTYEAIVGKESRDKALTSIVERFSEANQVEPKQLRDILPLISKLPEIEDSMDACRSLVQAIKLLGLSSDSDFTSLQSHCKESLRTRWRNIDSGWSRIDAGYGITKDLAKTDREEAEKIFDETEAMKADGVIASPQGARTLIFCIRLLIRSYCGLLPSRKDVEGDLGTIASLIDILSSYGERATLWGDLCMRAHLAGRSDIADTVCAKYLQPAVVMIPQADVSYRAAILIRIGPALYKSQPALCLEEFDKLTTDDKDWALFETVKFLLRRRVPSDPLESGFAPIAEVTYDVLLQVESLASRLDTDWMIYFVSEQVAETIRASKNRYSVTRPQYEDMGRRFSEIAKQKLPNMRQITHHGFQIITLAQAARMRHAKGREWTGLIEQASKLENISDRAFVSQVIALCLPDSMASEQAQLLAAVQLDIEKIPWALDRVDRLLGLADEMQRVDRILCRGLVAQAANVLSSSSGDMDDQRRQLVDIAFRVDSEFAKGLIDKFDDDDAKRIAKSQIQLLEIRKSISESEGKPEQEHAIQHLRSAEVGNLGSMLLRSLSAGRVQHFHPGGLRGYLELAANQTLSRSYSMFSWYVENAVLRYSGTDQASTILRPIFDACALGAQLSGQISGKSLIRLKALKSKSIELTRSQSLIITPRSRDEAIRILSEWFARSLGESVLIHDPYFGPGELEWLQIIRTARPDCRITVMTSRKHQPPLQPGEDLEDLYLNAWKRMYDQAPPIAEMVVIGGELSKNSPIHDRWLVSESAGLRLGTSLNSLGLTKDSEISELSESDCAQKHQQILQYINREKTDHNGERLRLLRFGL